MRGYLTTHRNVRTKAPRMMYRLVFFQQQKKVKIKMGGGDSMTKENLVYLLDERAVLPS